MPRPKKYAKNGLVQARLDNQQMHVAVMKANLYTKGNMSEWVREAVLNHRPIKKVTK